MAAMNEQGCDFHYVSQPVQLVSMPRVQHVTESEIRTFMLNNGATADVHSSAALVRSYL